MMQILVLGHNGMLGNAVYKYLQQFYKVDVIDYKWPSVKFIDYIKTYDGDFIINCIGAIPQKTNEFGVNSILPIFLDLNVKCKIIHPATDCESDNDVYGISKRIATDWLLERGQHTYIFKTSIIGIELNSSDSLLCWFLKQTNANGYIQAKWNGITTLEWAKQCKNVIDKNHTLKHTIFSSECISKFELLNIIKHVFQHDIETTPIDNIGKDKCLIPDIKLSDIKQQLIELKEFYKL
jgi:dTDP-4-dehydrorhamnose reductase